MKKFLPLLILVITVGLVGTLLFFSYSNIQLSQKHRKSIELSTPPTAVSSSEQSPASESYEPLYRKVSQITESEFVVSGEEGDMTIGKDPLAVVIYRQQGDEKVPVSYDVLRVGQPVVVVILPDNKVNVVLVEDEVWDF